MIAIKKIIGKKTEEDLLIENYTRILKEHPDEEMPDIHLKLGVSYEKIGEKEAAIKEYTLAAALYLQVREIYGACACNYLITQIDPSHRDALANLALMQFQAGVEISSHDCALFLQKQGITLNRLLHIEKSQEEGSQLKSQPPTPKDKSKHITGGKPRTRLAFNKTTRERQQDTHFQMERKSLIDLIEGNADAEEHAQCDESLTVGPQQNPEDSSHPDILIDLTQEPTSPTDVNVNLYQAIPLFSELSSTELNQVIQKANISTYPENRCIMRGRNEQQKFFVIFDGLLELRIEFYQEEQKPLTILLKKGDFWGEHSFLRQKGVSLTAIAKTSCTILELPKTRLISLAQRYSGILETLKNTCKQRCFYPTLSKSSLFTHLTIQERQHIAEYFFTMNVPKGADIITEGNCDKGIYVIKSGEVEVRTALVEHEDYHVIPTEQKQIRLAKLTAGDIFGEGTFFTKEPRSATISALTYTELLKLPAQSLTRMIRNYPQIGTVLKHVHQQRLLNTVKMLQNIS